MNKDHRSDCITVAVVVTYNPSLSGLSRVLFAAVPQVDRIVVVDNGSSDFKGVHELVASFATTNFISLSKNMGIGYAQNVGIRAAKELNAAFVLTLDQDSAPRSGMVSELTAVYSNDFPIGRIGAVGPLLIDEESGIPLPFFVYVNGRKRRIIPETGKGVWEVEFLVSSGSLLSMEALIEAGLMQEDLFISYVDVEWCLRAKSHNFAIVGCGSASMLHNLGEKRLKIGRFLIPLHSPLRHYYLMRSGVYMQRLPHVPSYWKRADAFQLLRSFVFFTIVGLPRIREFTFMLRGLFEGLRLRINSAPRLELNGG